jgi:hypothetical protein
MATGLDSSGAIANGSALYAGSGSDVSAGPSAGQGLDSKLLAGLTSTRRST